VEFKILTVSDGVVGGTRADGSGDALTARLGELGFPVVERRVCADGTTSVAVSLVSMCDGFAGVIVTTGGTGFSARDRTPEGTLAVVEREAPSLADAMRAVNPLGRLSRGVSGIRGACVICNVPGSPRGAVESLDAIIDVLPHAATLIVEAHDPHPHAAGSTAS
jgi:molybdenum cofactor synthesis domain-containing protein